MQMPMWHWSSRWHTLRAAQSVDVRARAHDVKSRKATTCATHPVARTYAAKPRLLDRTSSSGPAFGCRGDLGQQIEHRRDRSRHRGGNRLGEADTVADRL